MSIKKVAILTSGGDAPGMNAAIRAIVRAGINAGLEMYGVYNGYKGLCEGDIRPLNHRDVCDTLSRGGTMLGSARFVEFKEYATRRKAVEILQKFAIDALVVIGGDGSYMGAKLLTEEFDFPCIGIPGTIDNDIAGTDFTIGYQTALETVVWAIDSLRDTSGSHQRISIVEVMGRHCGELALNSAIAGGAEFVIIPEIEYDYEYLRRNLIKCFVKQKKRHAIIAVTEHMLDVQKLAKEIEEEFGYETRATVLGHIQRGGSPCPFDRLLASRMGVYAVDLLLQGEKGRCIGILNNKLVHHDIIDAITNMKHVLDEDLYLLAERLV